MTRTATTIGPGSATTPTLSTDAVVVCQNLTKVYKDFWMRARARAVMNLSFEIRPREVFGLLGPNGSGKSTTIKIMLGLLRPSSGRVAVFGKAPTDVAIKSRVGYLPEESYLYGFLNARETLDYYGKLFELDHRTRTRRVDELLDMLGLVGAQFRPVREYSKGMQRRIGVAQALINDPDLLILDEPTTGLDPIGTKQIKDLIIELGRRGKTVLLSSHLLADVEDCVDRLVILYGGQKRAEGTCDELLVARDRTAIETDTLDETTVAEIDRLIRSRTRGERAIIKVTKPRQRLEDLFLDIVEQARNEHLATSGATAGGQTAAFLKGAEDGSHGESLIERLVEGPHEPAPTAPKAPAPAAPTRQEQQEAVISSLLKGKEDAPVHQPAPSQAPPAVPPQGDVDLSVIGKLMDQDKEPRR